MSISGRILLPLFLAVVAVFVVAGVVSQRETPLQPNKIDEVKKEPVQTETRSPAEVAQAYKEALASLEVQLGQSDISCQEAAAHTSSTLTTVHVPKEQLEAHLRAFVSLKNLTNKNDAECRTSLQVLVHTLANEVS